MSSQLALQSSNQRVNAASKTRSPDCDKVSKPKLKRSRSGCANCKRLKIKCNEGKPACEYCVQTRKHCLYPSQLARQTDIINWEKVRSIVVTNNPGKDIVLKLNSVGNQLGISVFEVKLLHFFMNFGAYAVCARRETTAAVRVWSSEIPILSQSSPLVRNAIFALSGLYMFAVNDFNRQYYENDIDPMALREYYFRTNLRELGKAVTTVPKGRAESVESFVSNFVLLVYLGIDPSQTVPLVSFEEDSTDYMTIARCARGVIASAAPRLFNTVYEPLLSLEERIYPPHDQGYYPYLQTLATYIDDAKDLSIIEDDEYCVYKETLDLFQVCIYRTVKLNYPMPLFKFLALINGELLTLVKAKKMIALKMLFSYSCLAVFSGFRIGDLSNIWATYAHWYARYMKQLGGFDAHDAKLYHHVKENDIYFEFDMSVLDKSLEEMGIFGEKKLESLL